MNAKLPSARMALPSKGCSTLMPVRAETALGSASVATPRALGRFHREHHDQQEEHMQGCKHKPWLAVAWIGGENGHAIAACHLCARPCMILDLEQAQQRMSVRMRVRPMAQTRSGTLVALSI
jgi:hypothetical protein